MDKKTIVKSAVSAVAPGASIAANVAPVVAKGVKNFAGGVASKLAEVSGVKKNIESLAKKFDTETKNNYKQAEVNKEKTAGMKYALGKVKNVKNYPAGYSDKKSYMKDMVDQFKAKRNFYRQNLKTNPPKLED